MATCLSLHDLSARAAHRFGERPFLERWLACGRVLPPITFIEFHNWVVHACGQLHDIGVTRGDRIALAEKPSRQRMVNRIVVIVCVRVHRARS